MLSLDQKNIDKYYGKIKESAAKYCSKGDFDKSIACIDFAAIMMGLTNSVYKDDQLEQIMKDMSVEILPRRIDNYLPIKDRFVFYDQIGNHTVLTLQYLRAMMDWSVEFLYIIEPSRYSQPEKIIAELGQYPRCTVLVLDHSSRVDQIKEAYKAIVEYRAEKAFLHFGAEGATGITLWNALSQIVRFRIVPGDHHFYLGPTVSDYAIEFRNYGIAVALHKRGFRPDQILKQSYYPIEISTPFQGFPASISRDSVIMFSGGAYYKTYGENDIFFEILKGLLDQNPELIILFAGGGVNRKFVDFITKNKLENRLILLGYRRDLCALMEHIDIYLGTYPLNGGLMSQYAALKAKPIVQYNTPDKSYNMLNGVLNYGNGSKDIDIFDLGQLYAYVHSLIHDISLRKSEGDKMRQLIITPGLFNIELRELIDKKNPAIAQLPHIEYTIIPERYIELSNKYTLDFDLLHLSMLRRGFYFFFPKLLFRVLTRRYLLRLIFNKILRPTHQTVQHIK